MGKLSSGKLKSSRGVTPLSPILGQTIDRCITVTLCFCKTIPLYFSILFNPQEAQQSQFDNQHEIDFLYFGHSKIFIMVYFVDMKLEQQAYFISSSEISIFF